MVGLYQRLDAPSRMFANAVGILLLTVLAFGLVMTGYMPLLVTGATILVIISIAITLREPLKDLWGALRGRPRLLERGTTNVTQGDRAAGIDDDRLQERFEEIDWNTIIEENPSLSDFQMILIPQSNGDSPPVLARLEVVPTTQARQDGDRRKSGKSPQPREDPEKPGGDQRSTNPAA